MFRKFVDENNGYFPLTVLSLPEGSVIQPHTPVYIIRAEGEYATLVTFMETLLTKVWYPTNVCTLSRLVREDIVTLGYDVSVDPEDWWTLDYRLHDFGARGCASEDQTIIGGMAHLINFAGSDTVRAAVYAQYVYNECRPVASSIPATEHSVMTSRGREGELDTVKKIIEIYGKGVYATVGDSYSWDNFLSKIVPEVAEMAKNAGGLWVGRPDSGDPVTCVLQALARGEETFGCRINKKGYKVINGFAVIQGDGINRNTVRDILKAVIAAGFSAQNVAFGMGGGLLQKHDRDTMRFATKLCFVKRLDGTRVDVMKDPKKTDPTKCSLPGQLAVYRTHNGYTVMPAEVGWSDYDTYFPGNVMNVVYDCGPVNFVWPTFDQIRARVNVEWRNSPKIYDPRSVALRQKIDFLRGENVDVSKCQ